MRVTANVIVNNLMLKDGYSKDNVETYIKENLAHEVAKTILESDIEITCKDIPEIDSKEYRIDIEVL